MPNWAFGTVKVTGYSRGVKSFVERFISSDDQSTVPGKRFLPELFRAEARAERQGCHGRIRRESR